MLGVRAKVAQGVGIAAQQGTDVVARTVVSSHAVLALGSSSSGGRVGVTGGAMVGSAVEEGPVVEVVNLVVSVDSAAVVASTVVATSPVELDAVVEVDSVPVTDSSVVSDAVAGRELEVGSSMLLDMASRPVQKTFRRSASPQVWHLLPPHFIEHSVSGRFSAVGARESPQ